MTATAGPLAARLARLESIVARLQGQVGGGEQLSPNYLTVDAQGHVGASFTGLVNALGLIIPTGPSSSPPNTNRIIWQRASDGADTADIFGTEFGLLSGLFLTAYAHAPDTGSTIELSAEDSATGASLQIIGEGAGNESVKATAGAQAAVIMDQGGNSTFPILIPGLQRLTMQAGLINVGAISVNQDYRVGLTLPVGLSTNAFYYVTADLATANTSHVYTWVEAAGLGGANIGFTFAGGANTVFLYWMVLGV